MQWVRVIPEALIWSVIAIMAVINVAVYSDVVHGDSAVDLRSPTPRAGAQGSSAAPTPDVPTPSAAQSASLKAEQDDSSSLPGRFVPTQGRQHLGAYPLTSRLPFCGQGPLSDNCYASNPPSSGLHLPVQGTVLLEDGNSLRIPPDPGVFAFPVPREAIPHIEEHAGVYIGYNCTTNACNTTAEQLKALVSQEISLGGRVVLSPDPDLDQDTIGMASWTRVDGFAASDYSDARVRGFIKAHSCRFDPELFCKARATA